MRVRDFGRWAFGVVVLWTVAPAFAQEGPRD